MIRDGSGAGKSRGVRSVTVVLVSVTGLVVRPVDALSTAALRQAVLRPGDTLPLPGDDEPAFYVGAFDGEILVGTGNVRPSPPPWAPDDPAWRLRGMATAPDRRGEGVGAAVLATLMEHCRAHGGGVFWCNARTPARRFYERAGLQVIGEPWEDPAIGPHVRMWMVL